MHTIGNSIAHGFLAWICCILFTGLATAKETVLLEVTAGAGECEQMPLSVPLPQQLAEAKHLWMQRVDRGTPVPVQRTATDPPQIVWTLQERLAARQSRIFRLSATDFDRNRQVNVACEDDGRTVKVSVRGKPVLTYHTAVVEPPTGMDSRYQRSGFIHPLFTPRGRVLTEAFPADHPHQHGIFTAWVRTEFDGREVDFWNQAGGTGTVEHVEVLHVSSGPVFGEFAVRLRYLDLTAEPEPVAALHETWTVRVYDQSDRFLVDLESRQQCATEQPLKLNEYHYGGMAFRGAAEWLGQPESGFLTSEGMSRAEGNHSRPHWTDAYGLVEHEPCGVAVLQHPSNPRFPSPVRLHPTKPYFVYTPVALGEMVIEPDQPLTARYRYVIHDGEPDAPLLDSAWAAYAEPPKIRVVE